MALKGELSKSYRLWHVTGHNEFVAVVAEADRFDEIKKVSKEIRELNQDASVHGILVQSPPPRQIDESAVVRALDPAKDVDGFHPANVAKLTMGDPGGFVPPLFYLR